MSSRSARTCRRPRSTSSPCIRTATGWSADLTTASGDEKTSFAARVDLRRRQIEVRVPRSAWDPGRAAVRMAAGVGLWDAEANSYLLPGSSASADSPGGAGGALGPARVLQRRLPHRRSRSPPRPTTSRRSSTPRGGATGRRATRSRPATSRSSSPASTSTSSRGGCATTAACRRPARWTASTAAASSCRRARTSASAASQATPRRVPASTRDGCSRTRSTYPKKPMPRRGYGLTLLLHSLSANYNQYLGTRNQSQFGERGGGSIVITPEARGPDEFYENYGAADVFDVWSDVARRWKLDPALDRHDRVLDGWDRLVLARRAVPGPVRASPADGGRRGHARGTSHHFATCPCSCGTPTGTSS